MQASSLSESDGFTSTPAAGESPGLEGRSSEPEQDGLGFTHLDARGRVHMVDVGDKPVTEREACAQARLHMQVETLRRLLEQDLAKGDALASARVAGIMAAKETSRLIPLCHPLRLSHVAIEMEPEGETILCLRSVVRTKDRTGVEMEALTAVTVAALTIYDMVKGIDRGVVMHDVMLLSKRGGRSGDYQR